MPHRHYLGFALSEESLKAHIKVDHGLDEESTDAFEDVIAWHTAQHPEITEVADSPSIEELSAQVLLLRGAVDELILNDLLGL